MNNKYNNMRHFEFDDACLDELHKYVRLRLCKPVIATGVIGHNNIRNCLCCRGEFKSEGKHNRMCEDCRKENGY